MKAYKGFNRDMTCLKFQYKVGEKYKEDKANLFSRGFHACENPLDCLKYYSPADSVYREVELDGVTKEKYREDSKVCGKVIKIGARLTIAQIVKGAIDFVFRRGNSIISDEPVTTSRKRLNVATSGDFSHAVAAGFLSNAASTGDYSNAVTTWNYSHAATSGNRSHAVTTGAFSNAGTSGFHSHAVTLFDHSHAITSGDCSHAVTTGTFSNSVVEGRESIAAVFGKEGMARAAIGSWLVLTERDGYYCIRNIKAIKIDGKKYKADTWYSLINGKVVEI